MRKHDLSTSSLLNTLTSLVFTAGSVKVASRVFLVTNLLSVGLLSVSEFLACVILFMGIAYVLLAMAAQHVLLKIWQASSHSGRLDDRLGNQDEN